MKKYSGNKNKIILKEQIFNGTKLQNEYICILCLQLNNVDCVTAATPGLFRPTD